MNHLSSISQQISLAPQPRPRHTGTGHQADDEAVKSQGFGEDQDQNPQIAVFTGKMWGKLPRNDVVSRW